MLNGEYPSATAGNLHELMFNYKNDNFSCSIQIDDVDGYFIETLSQKDEHTQVERDTLIENLRLSEGIIFFFPYQRLFDEKSIKEFNYEIDTIISKLKSMYDDRSSIPIPVAIAISKWDNSPHYQKENELEEALAYINNHKFLRLAKEKIEVNFKYVKIVPISAIGNDIKKLNPYNLKVPIEFFLEETYKNWVEKINKLENDKEKLLNFLSKINFDMKSYDNGKYDKLYKSLEKEYAQKLLKELERLKSIQEYKDFEKKYKSIINSLLPKNIEAILKVKKQLSRTQKVKRFSGLTLMAIIIISILAWNADKLLIKNESELFADIVTNYNNNNYEDAQDNIEDYLSEYADGNTINLEHKQKILTFKSQIDETLKKREREKRVTEVLSEAQKIVVDKNFYNIDRIDEIFTSMNEMGIDDKKLKTELLEVKDRLATKENYSEFKDKLESKSFSEALSFVQTDWQERYGKDKKIAVGLILNKLLNRKVKELLEDISDIVDVDAYNNLDKTLKNIKDLQENTGIEKVNYKATLNDENKNRLEDILREYRKYSDALKNGIVPKQIAFGAESKDNEPLGFECSSEYQIILNIDIKTYHYDNNDVCDNIKMSWRNSQNFSEHSYSVKVIEEDLVENDEYSSSFSLNKNDLIKLVNHETIKKDIGKSYYIEISN
ncbi:Exonuclease sbcC [hydrothermal vent metagenome]|uniref:Exonuclease sbcC n=1 Tax=hydrothermal vent metagenome TaxID=652676 RepID=A0A1W1CRJ5_9ZZZZ